MNSILFMFVALLGLYSCSKIEIFSSNLAKEKANFTLAKEMANMVEGSLRTYLENQLEEEQPKQQFTFSFTNIKNFIMPDAQKEKIEYTLLELIEKVAHQKANMGLVMIIKAIREEDYTILVCFLMVALRYDCLIV